MTPRGKQVAVLSSFEPNTNWRENEGVFDSVQAAQDHAELFGVGEWRHFEHGPTRACWEAEGNGKVWTIEQFIIEPLDPPKVRRVGRRGVGT